MLCKILVKTSSRTAGSCWPCAFHQVREVFGLDRRRNIKANIKLQIFIGTICTWPHGCGSRRCRSCLQGFVCYHLARFGWIHWSRVWNLFKFSLANDWSLISASILNGEYEFISQFIIVAISKRKVQMFHLLREARQFQGKWPHQAEALRRQKGDEVEWFKGEERVSES